MIARLIGLLNTITARTDWNTRNCLALRITDRARRLTIGTRGLGGAAVVALLAARGLCCTVAAKANDLPSNRLTLRITHRARLLTINTVGGG